jgi:hypothetical protein
MAATLALTLSLSACGGSDDAPAQKKLTVPKAGQCIAKEIPDGKDMAPDTESVVPCNKDHGYEIVAAFKIPRELLAGKTKKAKLARRTELADIDDDKSKLREELSKTVFSKCEKPFREASGLDKLTVLGKSAEKVSMTVSANVSTWYTISSPELWLQGKAMGVCSFRFADGSDTKGVPKLSTVRSTSTKPVMASYLTKEFPVTARGCAEYSLSDAATCDQPHTQERLWVIDIKAVYGRKFLSEANLKRVSADELTKIRAACNDSYKQVGGTISEARPMGYRFFDEIPTTEPRLPIICTLPTKNSAPDRTFSAF